MLTKILSALKSEFAVENAKEILWNTYSLVHLLEDQYCKDGNMRDATIDTICEFLKERKAKALPVTPVNTVSQETSSQS